MARKDFPARVTRAWLNTEQAGEMEPTPELMDELRAFIMPRWRERELARYFPEPDDLSRSCKFTSLFLRALIGGRIAGNEEHQFVIRDGEIYDLNAGAMDVQALDNPYLDDEVFIGSRDHCDSLTTCLPRVAEWLSDFRAERTPPPLASP